MQDISFQAKIKPITTKEFNEIASGIKNSVDYPWQISSSAVDCDVFTKRICDCSSCVISNGKDNVMMHLRPDLDKNHNFTEVLNFLKSSINLNNQEFKAVLVGSKNTKKSLDIYTKFKDLFTQLGIPFSELKNGKTPTHIAFLKDSDEVLISNRTIDSLKKKDLSSEEVLNKSFSEVVISKFDTIE